MRHLDDAELATIALRGLASLEPERQEHLDSCPECRGEAGAFSSLGSAARSQDTLEEPPAELWERIAAELGEDLPALKTEPAFDSAASGEPFPVPPAESAAPNEPPVLQPVKDQQGPARGQGRPVGRGRVSSGPESRRHPRRTKTPKRGKGLIAGVAVAGLLLGAAIAVGTSQWLGRDNSQIMEQAVLKPLPGWDSQGTARVENTAGRLQLVVELPDNPVSGFREVWLLDLAGKTPGLLSVGTLNGDRGVFDLPAGVDLTKYNVVDVSHEPFDGNPGHSSDSIVRGELGSLG